MDLVPVKNQPLTRAQFDRLAEVPPEDEWLANIENEKTQRAYKNDVREFIRHTGLVDYTELRSVVRAHVIDWRLSLARRKLKPATIRRKLSALASLFDYLCNENAVASNPVDGVERPAAVSTEGSTPALGDAQARKLLEAPHLRRRSRAFGIARYWPLCFITGCAERNFAGCGLGICTAARASCTFGSKVKAIRSASSR